MKSQGLDCEPEAVPNLKGDDARAAFIKHFKEVQRLKTQLDQYTDLTDESKADHRADAARQNTLRGFRGAYLETAQRLKRKQGKGDDDRTTKWTSSTSSSCSSPPPSSTTTTSWT